MLVARTSGINPKAFQGSRLLSSCVGFATILPSSSTTIAIMQNKPRDYHVFSVSKRSTSNAKAFARVYIWSAGNEIIKSGDDSPPGEVQNVLRGTAGTDLRMQHEGFTRFPPLYVCLGAPDVDGDNLKVWRDRDYFGDR
jgi:hypothetical protein